MSTTLSINGKSLTVDVPEDTPLLWTLRDVLGLTGTKFGCGMALCGACTVHLDGAAARARAGRSLRRLAADAGCRLDAGGGGEAHRAAPGSGVRAPDAARRRLRPPGRA